MAIADGEIIAIKFTQPLVGNVTGLNPALGSKKSKLDISDATVTTLNQYSTSYTGAKAVDGSTSTYWRGTTAVNWLQIQLAEAKAVTQLKLYLSSYYVKTFTFSASNDGETWVQLGGTYTAASSATAQWYTFAIKNLDAYSYYRVDTLTAYSTSRIYIYELELYEDVDTGNETKFTATFQQYNFAPGGSLSMVTRRPESMKVVDEYTILLIFTSGNVNSFQRAAGNITVKYDGSGTLRGLGGPVLAFELTFTPEELDPKNNPHNPEHLEIVDIVTMATLTHIYYTNTSETEHIDLRDIVVTSSLLHIDDI